MLEVDSHEPAPEVSARGAQEGEEEVRSRALQLPEKAPALDDQPRGQGRSGQPCRTIRCWGGMCKRGLKGRWKCVGASAHRRALWRRELAHAPETKAQSLHGSGPVGRRRADRCRHGRLSSGRPAAGATCTTNGDSALARHNHAHGGGLLESSVPVTISRAEEHRLHRLAARCPPHSGSSWRR